MNQRTIAPYVDTGFSGAMRSSFLDSHRAISACSHELEYLFETIVRGVSGLDLGPDAVAPTTRRSPTRCIVQAGEVALTLTWLQSSARSVSEGELLAIVWHGAVAPNVVHKFERGAQRRGPASPTSIWENVFIPNASSVDDWMWQPKGSDVGGLSSGALADRCLERLQAAYATHAERGE